MEYGLTREYAQNIDLWRNPIVRHMQVGVILFTPYMTAGYDVVPDDGYDDPDRQIPLHRPWYTLGLLGRNALIAVAGELEKRLGPSAEEQS